MNWRATKQAARDIVHATMGYAANYQLGAGSPVRCTVRHHKKSAFIGDDTDEFSPGLLSEIERVIVDLREVPSPARNAKITFLDDDGNPTSEVVKINTVTAQGENYVMCEVVPV